jgi:hypothetical protein
LSEYLLSVGAESFVFICYPKIWLLRYTEL